jgi:hypothetical protein
LARASRRFFVSVSMRTDNVVVIGSVLCDFVCIIARGRICFGV